MTVIIKPVAVQAMEITCPCGYKWIFKGRREWSKKHAQCPSCYKTLNIQKAETEVKAHSSSAGGRK